tara:strand:- start:2085 stop:2342 length:258 start_codon:yes stop_codon:yes gene_type:complete
MKYEYKVVNFQGTVKDSDKDKGAKIAAQLESLFEDYSKDGWELQGQYNFPVKIEAGCLASILGLFGMGGGDEYVDIYQLVFRKEV